MSKKQQGNDQVIAEFFKKSLWVIIVLIFIIVITIYVRQIEPEKIIVSEKTFQAPRQLSKQPKLPRTKFVEEAELRGINFIQENGATGERMLPETMGSGVGFIDYDNDGDQDLIFANGTNWPWNDKINSTQHLYANDGHGYFTDVSSSMGLDAQFYGTGIAIGDVNNDGYEDIFIAAVGDNHLYINHSGKAFIESKLDLNCTDDGWSTSSGFFDYDNDGDLDLMVLNYVKWSKQLDLAADYKIDGIGRAYGPPSNFPGTHSCLFENQSQADEVEFTDVSQQSGIIIRNPATNKLAGKSLALTFLDINNDDWQDVIVANDTTRNFVFINQHNKTFVENGAEVGLAYNASGKATGAMGLDVSYYNNDADVAVTVGNFSNEMTSFYVNRANLGFFTDESVITGIGPKSRQALSFGLFFFDYDLDGRLDFFQTNGHVENEINKVQSAQHYAQKSQLFWNCGKECERTFIPIEEVDDLTQMNLVGRATAYGDVDGDGDLDIIVTQVARKPKLFINQSDRGNWVGIRVIKNGQPISGVKISAVSEHAKQTFNISTTKSYLSQVQNDQIIGLGNDKQVKIVLNYKGVEKTIKQIHINNWNTISLD